MKFLALILLYMKHIVVKKLQMPPKAEQKVTHDNSAVASAMKTANARARLSLLLYHRHGKIL